MDRLSANRQLFSVVTSRCQIRDGSWRRKSLRFSLCFIAEHEPTFGIGENPPPAWLECLQGKLTNLHTDQSQRRMPDGGGHPAHLAVLAFAQLECHPAGRNILPETNRRFTRRHRGRRIQQPRAAGQGFALLNPDASLEMIEVV